MRRQMRINRALNLGVIFEESGQLLRVVAVPLNAHGKRLEALAEHPGVERRQRRTRVAGEVPDLIDRLLVAENHAADAAPMSVDVFRGRVHYQIGTEADRLLKDRRGKDVIDDADDAALAADDGEPLQVTQLEARIGWCLVIADILVEPETVEHSIGA